MSEPTEPTKSILDHPRWTALSSKRQNELLEEYRDINVDHEWWDFTYEGFIEKCEAQGITTNTADISFSGFWCQGDGACFAGYVSNWEVVLNAVKTPELLKLAVENNWSFSTSTRGRYSHSGNMTGSLDAELPENPYDEDEEPLRFTAWEIANPWTTPMLDDLEEALTDHFRGLADGLYRELESEYEYLTDDEQVVDWILDNLDDDELKDPDDLDEEDTDDEQQLATTPAVDFA